MPGRGVSVAANAVQGGIGCCKLSIHELGDASKRLKSSYQQAGSGGWRDQKYAALGGIVDECCSALESPIRELEDCINNLQQLLSAIQDYESVSL